MSYDEDLEYWRARREYIYVLATVHEMSRKEIGRRLGISLSNVARHLAKQKRLEER